MNTTVRISLDIHKIGSQAVIPVFQGDSGYTIVANLTEGGRPFPVDDTCTASFFAKKPNGDCIDNACSIKNNAIVYDFYKSDEDTCQTTSVAGKVNCQFKLVGANGKILASPTFDIVVNECVYSEKVIVESAPEYTILSELIAKLQNGIKGEINIEDLPIGVSYALENVSLSYINDGEMHTRESLSVDSGSCIIKTFGQVEYTNWVGETVVDNEAITVYIIPQEHIQRNKSGEEITLVFKKIVPSPVSYGVQYVEEEVTVEGGSAVNIIRDLSGITDPNYDEHHPNEVPSVGAVINYVANYSGGGSGGGSADAVLYTYQTLTEGQKAQARANIGVDEYIDQTILGGAW